ISTGPPALRRCAPESTIWATLMAVGSFTARVPVSVAKRVNGLTPLQLWQLAQASSNTALPSRSAPGAPSRWDADAGVSLGAGRLGVLIAGTERRYTTMAAISPGARWLKLLSTASPIGPAAVPWPSAWPVARYADRSVSLNAPTPL